MKENKVFVGVIAFFAAVAAHRLGSGLGVMTVGLAPILGLVLFLDKADRLRSDSWKGRLLRKLPGSALVLGAHEASLRWGMELRAIAVLAMMAWFYLVVRLAG